MPQNTLSYMPESAKTHAGASGGASGPQLGASDSPWPLRAPLSTLHLSLLELSLVSFIKLHYTSDFFFFK